MKTLSIFSILFLFCLLLNSCRDRTLEKVTYTANVPVYMTDEAVRAAVTSSDPEEISGAGKIHLKSGFIYLVDPHMGIHVIDNRDLSNPRNAGFIVAPGVVDIASSENFLYADSYRDLVTIDISDPLQIHEVSRVENVFPQVLPPTNNDFPISVIDEDKGVVVGWEVEEITEIVEVDNGGRFLMMEDGFTSTGGIAVKSHSGGGSEIVLNNGQSGSMARFIVYETSLYAVNERTLQSFDITNRAKPSKGSSIEVSRDMETLFTQDDKLFIGTTSGMMVYDISIAGNPEFVSDLDHVRSCDPVVVEGDYAYVTLRSTNQSCAGWTNQLDVIDISDIVNPVLIKSYPMTSPHGLGIDNGTLFICDGNDGLKVYDATDPNAIDDNMIDHFKDINTFDVIPYSGLLLMIGDDGLYQYDYTDAGDINLLSVIKTK